MGVLKERLDMPEFANQSRVGEHELPTPRSAVYSR